MLMHAYAYDIEYSSTIWAIFLRFLFLFIGIDRKQKLYQVSVKS